MTLSDWLVQNKLSPTDFAKRIGKPQATVSRYAAGKRIPEPETMKVIVEATEGAVTPNDFYGLAPPITPIQEAHGEDVSS